MGNGWSCYNGVGRIGRWPAIRCPLLPYSPTDVAKIRYQDAESPTGTLVSDLQRRLVELSATDLDGTPPSVTGVYDERTARILAHWIAADRTRWPDPALVEIAWGHPVTDCRVWQALGFACEAVDIVPGVTPMAQAISRAVEAGRLSLSCTRQVEPPEAKTPWWVVLALLATGAVGTAISSRKAGR